MKPDLFIGNVNAGQFRHDPKWKHVVPRVLHQADIAWTHSIDELTDVVKHAQITQRRTIWSAGGDGTHSCLLTLLTTSNTSNVPPLVLLPGGTMNLTCKTLGRPDFEDALEMTSKEVYGQSINAISSPLPTLDVSGRRGFVFGTGTIARFIEAYARFSPPSLPKAGQLLAKISLAALMGRDGRWFPSESLNINGRTHKGVSMLGAAAYNHLGFGFRPFPDASAKTMGVFVFSGKGLHLASLLPAFFLSHRPRPGVRITQFPQSRLKLNASRPFDAMMDGELLDPCVTRDIVFRNDLRAVWV